MVEISTISNINVKMISPLLTSNQLSLTLIVTWVSQKMPELFNEAGSQKLLNIELIERSVLKKKMLSLLADFWCIIANNLMTTMKFV